MLFEHRYAGSSGVIQGDDATAMSFVPDALRPPTYFRGRVAKQLEFREAISALHDVVTSDLRFIPKDRTGYLAWREQQSYVDLAAVSKDQQRIAAEIRTLGDELAGLEREAYTRHTAFYNARQKYFDYLYERDKDLWFKLDPVITVHPDQVFFECFSKDESSYGRLAASYEVFEELGERANGTTNIDYSDKLYGEFQKIRSYKTTTLDVDPGGFDVKTTAEDTYREVKIDLPDTWVRGFLQVSAAATLPAHVIDLHPMDVHNLLLILRRNKELFGPRSLRFKLTPGMPVSITVDPWNITLACPRSKFLDGKPAEIRIWGRRRLHILERLLPRATRVRVYLLGTGLPSYWMVDLGELSFTLGLSGWTLNNWSDAGNFDLMAAREQVDSVTQARVFDELGKTWLAKPEELATRTGLATSTVASALAGWVQAGRAIFDLDRGVYRKRELTRDPLPMEKLRFTNAREQAAAQLLHSGQIAIDRADSADGGLVLAGRMRVKDRMFAPEMTFDVEQRLVAGECSCDYFIRNRLHTGPCEHMLALRAAHRRGINDTITFDKAPAGRGKPVAPDQARENFQTAFRRAVQRAAELSIGRSRRGVDRRARAHRQARPARQRGVRPAAGGAVRAQARRPRVRGGAHGGRPRAQEVPDQRAAPASRQARRAGPARRRSRPRSRSRARSPPSTTASRALGRAADLVPAHRRLGGDAGLRRGRCTPPPQGDQADRGAQARQGEPIPEGTVVPPRPLLRPTCRDPEAHRGGAGRSRKITGKQDPLATADASLDAKLTAIVDEQSNRSRVFDRIPLKQEQRIAHAGADHTEGRVFAMVAALKTSSAIRDLPSDQELIALLRRELS